MVSNRFASSLSICLILFCGIGKSSGIVPPNSLLSDGPFVQPENVHLLHFLPFPANDLLCSQISFWLQDVSGPHSTAHTHQSIPAVMSSLQNMSVPRRLLPYEDYHS